MINILKQGSSLLITSDNNQFPWRDGKMSVPLNSIAYIIDESDYVTFRSVANNDILFTSLIGELKINNESVSKDNLITMFDSVANSSGSGGGTASAGVNSINGFQGDINIKTVNGTSLIGGGDISVEADLDNYYTKEESDDHYDNDKRYWNDFQYATDNDNWIHLRNGKSLRGYPIYFKTINGEKTVGRGDISFKTINGESLIGSGDITVGGGSDIEEYVKRINVDLDNSQIIYYYKNTDEEGSRPIMFKTLNGKSLLGMGDITIEGGSVEETDPIFTEWKNDSSIVCGNGAVNGINNFGTLLKRSNAVAIGNGASIQTDNSIAIGNNAKIFASTASSSKGLVAIGNEVSVSAIANDSTINKYVKTNINNQLKFATDDAMFIKGMSTNGTSNDWFIVNGEWTGTQSQYDALGTYYSNVTYNIIEG
jgi:hypothetical protein